MLMSGDDNAGVTVSDLALEMGVTSPAVSRRLNFLDQKGLTERFVDTKNRRNTFVTITLKGIEAVKNQENQMFAFMTRVVNIIGKEDFENTIRLLSNLLDAMEKIACEMEAKEANDKDTEIP
jgi:DNA-binding MarR family transcriptional regulator